MDINSCGNSGVTIKPPLALPSGTIQVAPPGTLTIAEGESETFRVKLSTAPSADVTISLSKTNDDISLDKTSLTFTTSNFATEQEVSVSADEDADTANDSDTITLSASGGITAPNVTKAVSVTDTTPPSGTIQVNPPGTLSVNEGGSETFRVRLSTAPNANVTISLTKTNDDIRLDKTSLTFTTSNFATEQEVSVSADEDADTANDSDTITLSASGGITAPNVTKAVSVTDTTPPSGTIQVNPPGTLSVNEGGSETFRVRLSTAPNANVTISLTKTNDDIRLDKTSLTFTTSNFATEQEVSVSADEDADTANDSDTITLSASGGITAPNVTKAVSVTDTTPPSGTIQVNPPGTLSVNEGGSETFRVRLSTAPNANVTISLTKTNDDIRLDKTSLTFTTSNFATEQEVSVSADEDADTANDSDTITLSASGGITAPNVTKAVSVTDTTPPSGTIQVNPPGTLSVNEGGSETFRVRLSTAPNANVTISLSKTNDDISLDKTSLTFTTSNFATEQEVSVSADEDADTANDSDTITLSASGGITAPNVTKAVSVTDTTPPSGTIQVNPPGTLSVNEGGSETFRVRLSTAPNANVTISLSKTNDDISLDKTSLTFTTSNFATEQEVSVSADEDADTANDSDTITLSASGGITAPNVTKAVSVTDTTPPSGTIQVNPPGTLSVNEGGSETFRVRLSTAPNANVTISLSKTNDDITLDKTSLTFSTSDWDDEQTVTVNADEDADTANDSDTITLSASGGITAPNVTKAVTVTDNDGSSTPSGTIVLSDTTTLNIDEGGSGSFEVSLSAAPNANVRVSLTKTNSDITLSPSSLTFDTSNYGTGQRVTVNAAEDADTTNDSDTITLTASGGITAPQVRKSVSVTDNDGSSTPSGTIVLSDTRTLTIDEGGSGSFEVSLSAAPNANVRVSLTKTNSDITLSPSSLTFDTSNYGTGQRVTVNAAEDADTTNDSDTITLTASGGITAPRVTKSVSVRDNDSPTTPPTTNPYDGTLVFLPEGNITIDEESRQTVSVKLSKRPTDTVSVLVSKTSNTFGIGFSREGMVFTETNWDRYQSIDIIAHKDSDKSDDSHFVAFEFAGKRILRSVIVRDNDKESLRSQALALPPPTSGDSATLRIRCLQDSPCSVALDCSAQADGEVFQGRLPQPIPAWGTASLSVQDIQAYTGGKSWSGKGRLGCALRSSATIGSQVWTRSGNGVLVNNSAMIRSVAEGGVHRADIESIPSPDSSDESNIRIRCNSQEGDCFETAFVCYTDDGSRYEWSLGRIERLNTRHLQSEELASGIGYRWEGLGLTCEVRSSRHFTAQVLTRTGGGGALVNNSATGVR